MITFFEASIQQLAVHYIGNKHLEQFYVLSDRAYDLTDEMLCTHLKQYFFTPFENVNEVYHFTHPNQDLNLNPLFHFTGAIFNDPLDFLHQSAQIGKYLYESTNHPKIKPGELYVGLLKDLQIDGELFEGIGIFKSETKEAFLKVAPYENGFTINYDNDGINLKKLDKGCIILNKNKEQGYEVLVVDQTNRGSEALYWKDVFLNLKVRNDSFNQTNNTLNIYKNFVSKGLDIDFELNKADKIDLLNKSMKYFKENDMFDLDEFSDEVLSNPRAIESFKTYKEQFELDYETEIPSAFNISQQAVKKQNRVYKSVLKLDKNFHIYIHGDNKLIERGFDDDKALNYYKVYFKDEA